MNNGYNNNMNPNTPQNNGMGNMPQNGGMGGMPPNNGMINQPFMNNNSAQMNREAYYSNSNNFNNTPKSNNDELKRKLFMILGGVLIAVIIGVLVYVGITAHKKRSALKQEESIKQSYIDDSMVSADDGTVGNDFTQYRVKIKDKRVYLPITYKELTGLTSTSFKKVYNSKTFPAKTYQSVNLYTKDDKLALYIEVYNPLEKKEIVYPEGIITRVTQIRSHVKKYGAVPITFPGELQVGMKMTEESIINLFGETNHKKTVNNDGYVTTTFRYVEKEKNLNSNFFEIELVNGVVTELTLDHRG